MASYRSFPPVTPDKEAFKRLLAQCHIHREQMPETTDSVKIIMEMREARANR